MKNKESTKLFYQAKYLEYKEPNLLKQIYSIKPTKLSQSNQYYQTKSTENWSKVQSQLELSLAQLSPSLLSLWSPYPVTNTPFVA